jgi:hypothetical protein
VNNVNQLAEMLGHGGKARIAEMCEISPFLVSRWVRQGKIPPKYNMRMKRGLKTFSLGYGYGDEWLEKAVSFLEPDVCPTCGQHYGVA